MSSLNKLKKRVNHVLELILRQVNGQKQITEVSRERWAKQAQKGEFAFHRTNEWRNSPEFMKDTALLFESFGYHAGDFAGKTIVDLGAGSKLRGKFFTDARIVAIEPMAADCIREIPWCDLNDAWKVFSQPAEEFISELEGQVDFVFSINVLDHCYNFPEIVANLQRYLKPGGTAFLSFDEHYTTDKMHPLILTDKICADIFTSKGFQVQRESKGFHGKFYDKVRTNTYGHGTTCLNYWLVKA